MWIKTHTGIIYGIVDHLAKAAVTNGIETLTSLNCLYGISGNRDGQIL